MVFVEDGRYMAFVEGVRYLVFVEGARCSMLVCVQMLGVGVWMLCLLYIARCVHVSTWCFPVVVGRGGGLHFSLCVTCSCLLCHDYELHF